MYLSIYFRRNLGGRKEASYHSSIVYYYPFDQREREWQYMPHLFYNKVQGGKNNLIQNETIGRPEK